MWSYLKDVDFNFEEMQLKSRTTYNEYRNKFVLWNEKEATLQIINNEHTIISSLIKNRSVTESTNAERQASWLWDYQHITEIQL